MVVKFQSDAHKQGVLFAQNCLMALRQAGFEVAEIAFKIKEIGVELDAIANNKRGIAIAFEFKGSWNLERPGSQRTDTVKKAIANGALFKVSEYAEVFPPILLLTSHLPDDGAALRMIETAIGHGILLDVIVERDGDSLAWYANAEAADIQERLFERQQKQNEMLRQGRLFNVWKNNGRP